MCGLLSESKILCGFVEFDFRKCDLCLSSALALVFKFSIAASSKQFCFKFV